MGLKILRRFLRELLYDLYISSLEKTHYQGLSLFHMIQSPLNEKSPIPRVLLKKNKNKTQQQWFNIAAA